MKMNLSKLLIILGLFDPNHLPPDPFDKRTTMAFVCFFHDYYTSDYDTAHPSLSLPKFKYSFYCCGFDVSTMERSNVLYTHF